ncbi:DUF2231 domain-containing protein [Oryzobacter terrae]|uniref:DUF2231 domain-containing protein n=1 Tax=Oryzobacter terrae TaxID=1620385 RepID=UPI00366DE7D9
MTTTDRALPVVAWTERLEASSGLEDVVARIEPTIRSTFGTGARGELLRGEWLGHALHPVLTDVVIGTWTSAVLLDWLGGSEDSRAARRLIGVGLLAVGPTAWTGWAEWSTAAPAMKRVGVVHAVTNGIAIGSFAGSFVARRRGAHRVGKGLALVGAGALTAAGYLGGHLAHSRTRP